MSAGSFVNTIYEADYVAGARHPIRLQPETLAAVSDGGIANDPPALPATNPISARVTLSNRGIGLRPRFVRMRLDGTPPTGYSAGAIARLVCLTPAFFNAVAPKGSIVTYLGTTWEVIGATTELAR